MTGSARVSVALLPLLALLLLTWAPSSKAVVIHEGDLVVSDLHGARLLVVHVDGGTVETLTPRPGSGPNHLVAPAGLVMSSSGYLYVVDNAQRTLVRVDGATGEQLVIGDGGGPIVFGADPHGLALVEGVLEQDFYVGVRSTGGIAHVHCAFLSGCSGAPLMSDANLATSRGIHLEGTRLTVAVGSGAGAHSVATDTGSLGYLFYYNAGTLLMPNWVDIPPEVPALDAAWRHTGQVLFPDSLVLTLQKTILVLGIPACSAAESGVVEWLHSIEGPLFPATISRADVAMADGSTVRCPGEIALAPDGSLFVTDTAFPFPLGGDAQVVWIGPANDWTQRVVVAPIADPPGTTAMPSGMVVSPLTIPEPDPALAVAAWAVLGCIAARKLRSDPPSVG